MADAQDGTRIEAPRSPIYLLPLGFGVALLVTLLIGVPLLPMGLELPESILLPLVLLTATPFAAVSASWAGTLLAPDRTRTRLLPVVGVSMATAAVVAPIVVQGPRLLDSSWVELVIFMVPLSAGWATWRLRGRLRGSRDRIGRDARRTLNLAIPVFFVGLIGPNISRRLSWSLYAMFGEGEILLQRVMSIAGTVLIASGILGLTLAMWWRFRRRGDRLGMDAAVTVGLIGLTPLIMLTGTSYVLEFLGVLP